MKTVINPSEMASPTGYSYAIKKTGTPVFISGQVALDGKGNLVGENDVAQVARLQAGQSGGELTIDLFLAIEVSSGHFFSSY